MIVWLQRFVVHCKSWIFKLFLFLKRDHYTRRMFIILPEVGNVGFGHRRKSWSKMILQRSKIICFGNMHSILLIVNKQSLSLEMLSLHSLSQNSLTLEIWSLDSLLLECLSLESLSLECLSLECLSLESTFIWNMIDIWAITSKVSSICYQAAKIWRLYI